jgi:hypothetical protein
MNNANVEIVNIFNNKDFLSKLKQIEKEIENSNLSYYNDTTTLSGTSVDSKQAKLKIIELYKPLIDFIKSITKTNFLTLYRSQETKPTFNKQANASVLSFTSNKQFAQQWAKSINDNTYTTRSKSVIIKIDVPIENIIGAKANLNQQEFYVENTGIVKKIIDKVLIKYNSNYININNDYTIGGL